MGTVNAKFNDYGRQVADDLYAAGIEAEFDTTDNTLNKKIRNAQIEGFNFQFVVGEKEMDNKSVNIRTRDNKQHGEHKIDWVINRLVELKQKRILNAEELFIDEQ